MCRWCEAPSVGDDDFRVEHRSPARLACLNWQGGHADVVGGGLSVALGGLRERVLEEGAFAPGPLMVATLAGSGNAVRCLVGAPLVEGATAPDGLAEHSLPGASYVTCWHRKADGAVLDRYQRLLDWIRLERLERDRSSWQHAEEYLLHADFADPQALRLMVPVRMPAGVGPR